MGRINGTAPKLTLHHNPGILDYRPHSVEADQLIINFESQISMLVIFNI